MSNEKVALVICPCWDIEFPPYGISLLSGILKDHNIPNKILNLNKLFHNLTPNETAMWDQVDLYSYWMNDQKMDRIFTEYL